MIGKIKKKGELTTQQIVILIIVITSFAIILFLIFRLNLGETSNKQICHNSVVLKSKGGGFINKLDCKTNYVCISGGGKCEGISPTVTIKVNLDNEEEIMKAIADEMVDCWWMFGEGEINYLNIELDDFLPEPACAICSIVKFDNKILKQEYKISYRKFYEYLNTIPKSETETYFTYLYNSYDVEKFQSEKSYLEVDLDKDFILDDEKYTILTGMKKGVAWGFGEDFFFYSYYAKSNELNSKLREECGDFVTKV